MLPLPMTSIDGALKSIAAFLFEYFHQSFDGVVNEVWMAVAADSRFVMFSLAMNDATIVCRVIQPPNLIMSSVMVAF